MPVDALLHLVVGRVERVVRIGEAHPAEPRFVRRYRSQPRDSAFGDPVGVVVLARNGVVRDLRRAGIAAAGAREHRGEAPHILRMVRPQPVGVVVPAHRSVRCQLDVFEAPPGPEAVLEGEAVLGKMQARVEVRVEVCLADERGAVARPAPELARHARRVGWQRDAVGDDAMCLRILAGQHRRARRHAHDVVHVGAAVVHAGAGQGVEHRRAGDPSAVHPQRVVALLVGGDEQDVAAGSGVPGALGTALPELHLVRHAFDLAPRGESQRSGNPAAELRLLAPEPVDVTEHPGNGAAGGAL